MLASVAMSTKSSPSPPTPSPLSFLTDAATPKVCLFSHCASLLVKGDKVEEIYEDIVKDLYVFDLDPNAKGNVNPSLDDPDLISISPALRFKCNFYLARCVINSMLYLFEGSELSEPEEKFVHVYDLSSYSSSQLYAEPKLVSLDMMKKLPSMMGLKSFPVAIPTPDKRKILVFSKMIAQVNPDVALDGTELYINFELFDYANERWEELPPLPELSRVPREKMIESYYFANDSTFVIHMEERYSFALHLNVDGDKMNAYWTPYRESEVPLLDMVYALDGGLCVSRLGLYNRVVSYRYSGFPPNPNVEDDYKENEKYRHAMTVADHRYGHRLSDDEEVAICVLYIEFDEDSPPSMNRNCTTTYPRVYIDVHEVDLATVTDGIGDGRDPVALTPRKTRSYKFDLSMPYMCFWVGDVLPVVYSGRERSGLVV